MVGRLPHDRSFRKTWQKVRTFAGVQGKRYNLINKDMTRYYFKKCEFCKYRLPNNRHYVCNFCNGGTYFEQDKETLNK